MEFSLFTVAIDNQVWEKIEQNAKKYFSQVEGHYVLVAPGMWLVKTVPCYAAVNVIMLQLTRLGVPFFFVPLSTPPVCCASADLAQAYKKLGVEVYNTMPEKI